MSFGRLSTSAARPFKERSVKAQPEVRPCSGSWHNTWSPRHSYPQDQRILAPSHLLQATSLQPCLCQGIHPRRIAAELGGIEGNPAPRLVSPKTFTSVVCASQPACVQSLVLTIPEKSESFLRLFVLRSDSYTGRWVCVCTVSSLSARVQEALCFPAQPACRYQAHLSLPARKACLAGAGVRA